MHQARALVRIKFSMNYREYKEKERREKNVKARNKG